MAQKVNIVLVDDIDGSEATETVSFGLDGTTYEIDLNDANAAALRDALATYVGHGRKVGAAPRRGRRLQPRQIAVFAQQDAYGDAGFAGVAKAFRTLGLNDSAIVRLNYTRNTVDVVDAVNLLRV